MVSNQRIFAIHEKRQVIRSGEYVILKRTYSIYIERYRTNENFPDIQKRILRNYSVYQGMFIISGNYERFPFLSQERSTFTVTLSI